MQEELFNIEFDDQGQEVKPKKPEALSVSSFLNTVNDHLTTDFDNTLVEGEVSDYRVSAGKWVSFTLKDEEEEAVLPCFGTTFQIKMPLEDGMKIKVWGRPRVYPKYGKFSLSISYIELSGEGSLKKAFEAMKIRFESEGLFDPARKRPLPEFPQTIGLIASGDSAAYSDFLKVLKHRMGGITIHHIHAQVQGQNSIPQIAQAFETFNARAKELSIELVVLARGGGSLEDLQSFNSEEVARAVFQSKAPVVVAVGHERDESLADWVADVRASTPSNAAEMVVRDRVNVLSELKSIEQNMHRTLRQEVEFQRERVERNISSIASALTYSIHSAYDVIHKGLTTNSALLTSLIKNYSQSISQITQSLHSSVRFTLTTARDDLVSQRSLLTSYNPEAVLKRGYSITRIANKALTSKKQIRIGEEITTNLTDGAITSDITSIS